MIGPVVRTFQSCNVSGHPQEDRFAVGENGLFMVVADGVTQYSYSLDQAATSYAALCAEKVCEGFKEVFQENGDRCDDGVVQRGFERANSLVAGLNEVLLEGRELDYSEYDLFGAVAAATFVCSEGHLHFGTIADCRVMVRGATQLLSNDGLAKFRSVISAKEFCSRSERFEYVHRTFRNQHAKESISDEIVGYGVLNGQVEALDFCEYGLVEVRSGDEIFVLSDGVTPFLDDSAFLSLVSDTLLGMGNEEKVLSHWKNRELEGQAFWDDKTLAACLLLGE